MRVLFASTANDGHFGPLLPFVRACAAAGHEVRVAAPASYGETLARAGLRHEPFADAPPELIGPIMARLPELSFEEADALVVREVFGRVDAQAALPGLLKTVRGWRPDVVVRESAEVASVAAAEAEGVRHVHVCIGMHEVAERFAEAVAEPVEELGRLAGLASTRMVRAMEDETLLSVVPAMLDHPEDLESAVAPASDRFHRFHEPLPPMEDAPRPAGWGDPTRPLVYVTFGSVAGSLPPFVGVFREALEALADLDVAVLMTVGRRLDPDGVGPVPPNARVHAWLPQDEVLAHAAAVLGHGGFGTTMGALAAGVPQVVTPLFTFDQVVSGEHVAALGAGRTTSTGEGVVSRGAAVVADVLADPQYAEGARRVAAAMAALPPPAAAVEVLAGTTDR